MTEVLFMDNLFYLSIEHVLLFPDISQSSSVQLQIPDLLMLLHDLSKYGLSNWSHTLNLVIELVLLDPRTHPLVFVSEECLPLA